jgi:FkbM family methyltransferase
MEGAARRIAFGRRKSQIIHYCAGDYRKFAYRAHFSGIYSPMAGLWRLLNRPEYLLQPKVLMHRVFGGHEAGCVKVVVLPWGLPLEVDTSELIGRLISYHGLFEIAVVETIFRLTDPADVFLDFGANIGYMSSAAVAAGAKKVISFEPHPEVFRRLAKNMASWQELRDPTCDRFRACQMAISDKKGTATLSIPRRFSRNNGLSSLETGRDRDDYEEVEVPTTTLTQVREQLGEPIGVLKMDVEGHELAVLLGSQDSLQNGSVRDIVFEDHQGMDSDVSRLLCKLGYSIFGLNKTPIGPVLLETAAAVARFLAFSDGSQSVNYLASRDPDRARKRMSGRGYRCMAKYPRSSSRDSVPAPA